MSFADNLKQIRKEKGLSQEELADIMAVSRQSVSKWELGESYPEIENLLALSRRLNISLDSLLSAEIAGNTGAGQPVTGQIIITSPYENVITTCYKVISSQKMMGGKRSPKYALFGVSNGCYSFWGEPTTFLAWYADQEAITREIQEIQQAIRLGIPTYELRYSAKVEQKWMRRYIKEE